MGDSNVIKQAELPYLQPEALCRAGCWGGGGGSAEWAIVDGISRSWA